MDIFSLTEFSSGVEHRHIICNSKNKRTLKTLRIHLEFIHCRLKASDNSEHTQALWNLTHQVRWQSKSSELSHTVLSGFGLLLSCSTGLDITIKTLCHSHYQGMRTCNVIWSIMHCSVWRSECAQLLTCGTRLTWILQKFSLFTLNWNCLKASMKGMLSMSPTVPPNFKKIDKTSDIRNLLNLNPQFHRQSLR